MPRSFSTRLVGSLAFLAALAFVAALPLRAADPDPGGAIDFGTDRWTVQRGAVTEHLGRRCFAGSAFLKDAVFEDGVVEVDVAVTGARSYPGVLFRMASPGDFERVYLRPHRAGPSGYPDAVQYVPGFNGVDGWQLYSGPGYTAAATIPAGSWIRLRVEVKGTQARVFLGDSERPVLRIPRLERGPGRGTVGVNGPVDGSAFFSGFRYRPDDSLRFDPPPPVDVPPGLVTGWRLSAPFEARLVDREQAPSTWTLPPLQWRSVNAAPSGLVDVARHFGRLGAAPDAVLARTVIRSEADQVRKYRIGYSDEVSVYLDGTPLFQGESAYRLRDPSFLGVLGLFDAVYLPLRKGDNEVTLLLSEASGGWGFVFQDAGAVFTAPGVAEAWRSPADFPVPETVAYDPATASLFVSGYDGYHPSGPNGDQAIARLSLDGAVRDLRWAEGLRNPVGLAVFGGSLYVAESGGLAEVEIATGKVVRRTAVPGAVLLNDVAVAGDGTVYLSDSGTNTLFRIRGGAVEAWLAGGEVERPNGLHLLAGRLLVGNNGDGRVKSVDLVTKEVRTVADLGPGIIDGIEADAAGNLLVSHWEGRLWRLAPSGQLTKLLDTTAVDLPLANFAWVDATGLAVFPTFTANRVVAYRLPKG
ncbi:MAG: hypothetical protein EDX89_22685 [Acidobacteria bacterium]|nr:MAG: hypothetical protein EDX89_22685 [Acidobacteriota bacterium]MCE7958695.1 hypothetical protein [Acidobacteria bacterium ACB2]